MKTLEQPNAATDLLDTLEGLLPYLRDQYRASAPGLNKAPTFRTLACATVHSRRSTP